MHRRTALITAASIAAVVVTGATAVGANIGILTSAGASDLGELPAVTEVATVEPIPTTEPTATAVASPTPGDGFTTQQFVADAAGAVEVRFADGTVRLGSVVPNDGWSWTSSQDDDGSVQVLFVSSDGDELEFFAEVMPDGTLTARVDETIIETIQGRPEIIVVQRPRPSPTATSAAAPTTSGSPVAAQPAATPTRAAAATPQPLPTVDTFDDSSFDDDFDDDSGFDDSSFGDDFDDDSGFDDSSFDDDFDDDSGFDDSSFDDDFDDDDEYEYEGADDDD